jgi:hypothetical protein
MDQENVPAPTTWGLPTPNAHAAYKSLAKYAKPIPSLTKEDVADLNEAWDYALRHFSLVMSNSRVLTYEEAKTHLDMKTSVGAPFNQVYTSKEELFRDSPDIDAWLEADFLRMALDPMWTCLFGNTLKEECRPEEKILLNKIRTFLTCGIDATVHGTRLFVDMNEKFYAAHLITASAVGLSPYKGNWDRMIRKLKIFKNGYEMDESEYDSSLLALLMWGCARFRWLMLSSEYQTRETLAQIKAYYRNLINSLVVSPDGTIVMKKGGNPSGSVNTITDNTIILYVLKSFAWIQNTPPDLRTYECFEQHVAKVLVGDDNTWTVSDEAHPYYNAVTVIDTWRKLRIITTTPSLLPRKAEELGFLSATTVYLDGVAVPLYDSEKLLTTLSFSAKEKFSPAFALERTAALLSVGWTDLQFRRFCRELIRWLLQRYDKLLAEDPDWISAKCQVLPDAHYYKLFTGNVMLIPQSLGTQVKILKPRKTFISIDMPNGKRTRTQRPVKKVAVSGPLRANGSFTSRRRGKVAKSQPPRNFSPRIKSGGPTRSNQMRRRRVNRNGQANRNFFSSQKSISRNARSCTIENDELLATVLGSTSFTNTSYPINPGQAGTFPWLYKIAAQWEKYHFNYLEFYYRPTVSGFADQGKAGKVIMMVEFDAAEAAPATKVQMEDTVPHADAMPFENFGLPLSGKMMHPLSQALYVRPGGLPGGADIKTYDVGNFNIATQGMAGATEVGELRVRFSCTFTLPVLDALTTIPRNNSVFYATVAAQAIATGVPENLVWVTSDNGIGATNDGIGGIVLPAGNYMFACDVNFIATGTGTIVTLDPQRAGVSLLAQPIELDFTGTIARPNTPLSWCSGFFTSNGSQSFSTSVSSVFTTGATTVTGTFRIVAV